MNLPTAEIRFDQDDRVYQPGETLAGEYHLVALGPEEIKAMEFSVLWSTEGKGDEDMAVHQFQRLSSEEGDWIETQRPAPFTTVLPNSPLSYEGEIVKIRWCVRLRVFLRNGKEIVGEAPFALGDVPAASAVAP